jgi:hypothetical protein
MVDAKEVKKQLKRIGFNPNGWGRTEASELPNILLPDEEIYEVVNGIYEGGFALLVSTDVRVLLIDKKPLNYLTVEDLRFDMINEMDYSHRLLGAHISIATGNKNLKFTSINQPRLRKLIGHVQHCMAEAKKKQTSHAEDQKTHLEQINQQLQAYLVAQHQHQLQLQEIQRAQQAGINAPPPPPPVKPSPELSDYLFAQSLLAQYQAQTGQPMPANLNELTQQIQPPAPAAPPQDDTPRAVRPKDQELLSELYTDGMQEVFGKHQSPPPATPQAGQAPSDNAGTAQRSNPIDINAMKIAYSKLPMALRNRKFGRPSFHDHSAVAPSSQPQPTKA